MANRLFGFDVALFEARQEPAGGPNGPTLVLLGQFSNLEMQFDQDQQESKAVKDLYTFVVGRAVRWTVPVTLQVEDGGGGANVNAYDIMRLAGARVRVKIQSAASGFVAYDGWATLMNPRHAMGEGAQTLQFELVGQGTLAVQSTAPTAWA
jgi:hypothetical protein